MRLEYFNTQNTDGTNKRIYAVRHNTLMSHHSVPHVSVYMKRRQELVFTIILKNANVNVQALISTISKSSNNYTPLAT